MSIADFNQFLPEKASTILAQCCTSERWIKQLVSSRPFPNQEALLQKADDIWWKLEEEDYLEAFRGHPKIGDMQSLKEKYSSTKALAANEQSSLAAASESVLIDLMQKNEEYEKKFGFIFIVCATGKSAEEMLSILLARLSNNREEELTNASEEQRKIYQLRLEKLL